MFPNLSALWHEVPIVVIDTETTGLTDDDEAIEIAAVRFEAGRAVAQFQSLVNPGTRPIHPEAQKVHGISPEMVRAAPRLSDLAGELFMIADGAIACAYNAPFDRRYLHKHITGTDCATFDPSWAWIDVYTIVCSENVDKYVKGPGRLRLGATCFRWQVEHQSAHRALGDAQATGELLWRLFERGKISATCKLDRLLSHTETLRGVQQRDHARWQNRQGKAGGNG